MKYFELKHHVRRGTATRATTEKIRPFIHLDLIVKQSDLHFKSTEPHPHKALNVNKNINSNKLLLMTPTHTQDSLKLVVVVTPSLSRLSFAKSQSTASLPGHIKSSCS